ncbi:MAG TPA: OmpA family protein [Candidatus Acidoferrales bacterium]|nr:OmpA family protein [Candidatus Acidoferrales bacterium]
MRRLVCLFTLAMAIALTATTGFAQDGKLKVKVTPKHAYVFVDGKAIRDGSETIPLAAGKHTVVVVNYGYKISTQDVNIDAGKTTPLTVTLESSGGPVNGPFGQIEVKGDGHSAVLLNGTTPPYFVGHVGAMNHDWWWHRNLFVPPGTYHATVTRNGKDVWSGDVMVVANQKISIDTTKNGAQKMKNKPDLAKRSNLPRYKGGWISDTLAVAGVTGSFASSTANINCGQSSTLSWQTAETADANIGGVGPVATSGSQSVSPHATTTYDFTANGPGGTVKGTSTVNVNTKVDASLTINPAEAHYRKIGDKVITQDSATLTWQTSNADSVNLDPGGKVDPSGSQSVKAEPADTSQVPDGQPARTIDETKNFTLNATNVCGGSSTQTAGLHVTGSVEPIPAVTLQSVFYPTDYPDKRHPQLGLVRSQQLALATLADGFKKYLEYDPDAKLSVEAYADDRGSKEFNQDLSERRVERIKQYLVDQGIAANKVETAAYGKERPLDRAAVKALESTNPNIAPKARLRDVRSDWLAYNRRADIVLLPAGKKSAQFFPHSADDSKLIWQVPKPSLAKVQADQ